MNDPARQPKQGLTLIHFGDLHLWHFGLDGDWFPKRFLGLGNLALRRGRAFPRSLAQALLARIAQEEADYVVFSGDLTTTSLRREFETGRQLFEPIFKRWGERFIAIPGNHDRYTPCATRRRLAEDIFLPTGATDPFAIDLVTPGRDATDNQWTLIGADVSTPRLISSRGRITPEKLHALAEIFDRQKARKRNLLLITHYPMLYPADIPAAFNHVLPERQALLDLARKAGVRLHLHGHKHHRWQLQDGDMTALNCGSAGQKGHRLEKSPGYLKIQLSPDGKISTRAVWLRPDESKHSEAEWTQSELPVSPLATDASANSG